MISRLKLVVVGKLKNKEISSLVEGYDKKIARYIPFEIIELKDAKNKEKDARRILKAIEGLKGNIVALTEEGIAYSSSQFAQKISTSWQGTLTFIIGGPDGLDERVKQKVDQKISFSKMTFTHEMAQLIFHEQVFRAFSIIHKTGYHREG